MPTCSSAGLQPQLCRATATESCGPKAMLHGLTAIAGLCGRQPSRPTQPSSCAAWPDGRCGPMGRRPTRVTRPDGRTATMTIKK
ncbi:hypothetical protein R1flu_004165 [Riccia fluitans]|uniref:Uncharacterized protein n=1 Tax=Riccia fluitans TaxID=41844 RepID=A0ABD1YPH2_9MARC